MKKIISVCIFLSFLGGYHPSLASKDEKGRQGNTQNIEERQKRIQEKLYKKLEKRMEKIESLASEEKEKVYKALLEKTDFVIKSKSTSLRSKTLLNLLRNVIVENKKGVRGTQKEKNKD